MNGDQKTRLLTAEDIALMLKVKVQTVYTIARRGELEKVKLSRRCLRFRADEVERFIERRPEYELTSRPIPVFIGHGGNISVFTRR
jgi:excisionase family DNA binding protein